MKKKVVVGSVAALLVGMSVCSYQLGRYQSQQEEKNRVAYIDENAGDKKTSKQVNGKTETLTPAEVSAKENIDAEQIVVKITDQGYVTSHGDHFHYYNGKVPFDAIFSEELIMKDPNYVLQDSHIVNRVKNGYVIKVDGKYYLYLTDKQKRDNVRSKEEVARQKEISPADANEKQSGTLVRANKGVYSTDDGYVFRPTDVIEDTGDGFIVPHGDHFHFIPKKDLSASELKAAQDYWNKKAGVGQSTNHLAEANPSQVGPLAIYQDLAKPFFTPALTGSALNSGGLSLSQGQGVLSTLSLTKSPSDLLAQLENTPLSQRHVEADGLVFDPRAVTKRTSSGVVVPHGDHFHFIPYSQLSALERRIVDLLGSGSKSTAPSQPAPSVPIVKPILPNMDTKPSTPLPPSGILQLLPGLKKEKHDHEAHEAPFDVSQIISGDGEGYVVAHGDHTHYFYKKDLTPEQIEAAEAALAKSDKVDVATDAANLQTLPVEEFSRDASDEEKIAYIAKTYGIPLEAIRSSNDYFVFNNPDHAYDPTHIHPYAVLKKNVRIPLVTGQAEIDLLNELYATALRSGVSPYRLKIENGTFVIPHDGHNHYIRVQTENIQEALSHRLPTIHSSYVAGSYDSQAVREKIQSLIDESKKVNEGNPAYHCQIVFALESFWETVSRLASNSTEGYLAALEAFNQQYIRQNAQFVPKEESQTDKQYRELVAKVEGISFENLALTKEDFLSSIQQASVNHDATSLAAAANLLTVIENLDKQPGHAGADLLRQFYENYRDPRLSTATRQKVEDAILNLYKSQVEKWNLADIRMNFLANLRLKDEMLEEIATSKEDNPSPQTRLDTEKSNDISYTERVGRFLDDVYGIEEIKQDQESREIKLFLKNLSQDLRRIRNRSLRNRLNEQLESYVSRAYDIKADKSLLLLEVKELPHYIQAVEQDPERLGKKNTEIAFSEEEVAKAKEAGKYTTSDGYIFDPKDVETDEGDAYVVPHLNHSHWIPKSQLSETERKLADYYAKVKGLVPASSGEEAAQETSPAPDTSDAAAGEVTPAEDAPVKESTEAIYDRVAAEKRVPYEVLPYNTAYVVGYQNGRLIIPHYDHYHNIALAWFDNGHYKAPAGYSLEDFLATVKYLIEHPAERPTSDQGWGINASVGSDADEEAEEEEVDEEEIEEEDDYSLALKERATAFGMTKKAFEDALISITLRYGVSLENVAYTPENKTIALTDKEGQAHTISLVTLEEVV